MIKHNLKLSAFALLAVLAVNTPAFAETTPDDVASDVGAVQKDNAKLNKYNNDIAHHRAAKAADKANGNVGSQAVDSVNIGVDKMKRGSKETERNTDQHILNHDVNDATGQQ